MTGQYRDDRKLSGIEGDGIGNGPRAEIRTWDAHSATAHDGNLVIINNHFIGDACIMSVKAIATFHGLKDILNVCITKDSTPKSDLTETSLKTSSFCKQKKKLFFFSYPKTVAMPTLALPCLNLGKSLIVTNFCL